MISRHTWRALCAIVWTAAFAAQVTAQTPSDTGVLHVEKLAGRYQLEGVREVGAELWLRPDNRFEFGMAYGGADQSAQGRWDAQGRSVTLTSDRPPSAGFKLNRKGARLPDVYAEDPSKPTLFVISVKTPSLGLTWLNMAIVAEFSNGQSRAGVTGSNGMLGFLARTEPEWRGAYVRRISVAYPKGEVGAMFFSVDTRSERSIEINFEPGPLAPQAFDRAVFDVRGDSIPTLVQQTQEGPGELGWKFVRR